MKQKFVLILICALFLLTRLYRINDIPASVYWDEASIGYNAYSIAVSGKDEWGDWFPLHFRAFGEFKLPVYIYAVVPFVKFFGLNEVSVRLPSVLFSLGTVLLVFFLAKKLSGSLKLGLFSAFFMTVSPWFFIFSRTGYEATAGLMFYLLGILFFLSVSKNKTMLIFSVLSFILSAYSYNSFRMIIPFTMLILIFFERKDLKLLIRNNLAGLWLSLIFILLSVIPVFRLYVYDSGGARFTAVGADPASIVSNYLSHFNPFFLFFDGDSNLRSQLPDFGQLYLPDLFLFVSGIYILFKSNIKNKMLPFVLLLLAPVPAALTRESPHALRSLAAVPFISIILATAAGKAGRILTYIIIIVYLGFFASYFLKFLNVYPQASQEAWQYDYKQSLQQLGCCKNYADYSKILISDKYGQPYIFALFYLKYDPDKFRKEVERNNIQEWGFSTVAKFGEFEFGKFEDVISFEK